MDENADRNGGTGRTEGNGGTDAGPGTERPARTEPAAVRTSTPGTARGAGTGERDLGLDRHHSARIYDYFLGGKTNFPPDREVAEKLLAAFPGFRNAARANRAFMHRAARYLAERGIHQFLDIGTGIPTSPNLHEVVQSMVPAARVVYADNDPIVLAHARALLTGSPEGRTAYVEADITEPDSILDSAQLLDTLDMKRPLALCLVGLMHYIVDERDASGIVRRLVDQLPSGSYVVISQCTPDFAPEEWEQAINVYKADGGEAQVRPREEFARFFDGLELVEPGIEVPHRWHPDPDSAGVVGIGDMDDALVSMWAGVALKR
ncbi:SAM-dependent methyltransferase [Streptomyces iconiensis]|uniref:SAM-dependent methyltransferase n=1 Tax=Streptomyces iconiensis TaxID=1384038 RepID=A0ABT6ZUZ5_9ACTN|nr:SAM-dependent methyltransferase [Streptomyces iconiensis]MDJ1132876.1 SAM-dependent methyltransferase [Streptomyces iconiensis]